MSTYKYLNKISKSDKRFFTTSDLKTLLEVESSRTFEDIIKRLVDEKVLTQLEKGKYVLTDSIVSDFEIAQFLYSPSYISFETALNFYGILSQFPIEIASVTTKTPIQKEVLGKSFTYSKLNTNLFTGYYKESEYLIAYAEKALFDQLYMIAKGIKTEQYLDEMDYSKIERKKVEKYIKIIPEKLANSINKLIRKYL